MRPGGRPVGCGRPALRSLALAVLCGCLAGLAGAAESPPNLLSQPEPWQAGDPEAWAWKREADEPWLRLEKQSDYQPPVRSPFNLIWFEAAEWEEMVLEVELRLTTFNRGNNDLCLAFAGQSDRRFYYAHLGQRADRVHHQIHLVDGADRKPITSWRTEGTPWQPDHWHQVRLVHRPDRGEILVEFDGKPVLKATDQTLRSGRIGLGSFDDTGDFRRLRVTGRRVEGTR